jgi:hypothetical protein
MGKHFEEVILEEARRAIGIQMASLDELRARTGLLLAASSLSASFLGSAAATGNVSLGFVGGLAVIAFVIAIGACIRVLWPARDGWIFVTSVKILAEDWIDQDNGDVYKMERFVAEKLEKHFDANKQRLDPLFAWFQVAACAVGFEVVLGGIQITM